MRTNQVNQNLHNGAVGLPSDGYRGEFFTGPDNTAIEGVVLQISGSRVVRIPFYKSPVYAYNRLADTGKLPVDMKRIR